MLLWGEHHLELHCFHSVGMVHSDSACDKRNILS